jgi:hypothetical protein
VPLRIAFDLDGVLADMESELIRHAEVLFGEAMTRHLQDRASETAPADNIPAAGGEDPPETQSAAEAAADNVPALIKLNMTTRQQRRLWRHVETIDNFWETLNELEPGVIKQLSELATARRWEIIFLTKRPETVGATAQVQSQRWLESKGFELPSVYVVQGSRGRIAAALGLDIVIDDRPENCLDVVVDSKARAILVWRTDEKNLPAAPRRRGHRVVDAGGASLDILSQIDTPKSEQPGVMARVMRLLGLKEPAPV